MHIPDGFLDVKTVSLTNAFSILTLIYSIKKIIKKISPERVPLLGLSASFIFLIESISFPVPYGTSVHLLGAFFISLILGPFSSFFICFLSLFLQALILSHGGILTIGANSFNTLFISSILGFYIYKFFFKIFPKFENIFIFSISIFTVCLGSFFVTLELSISGKISFYKSFFPMIFSHFIAGIIEGIFTVFMINFLKKIKPEILKIEKI
ncbi:MAG: energy-coupling factor ABC transporter permease [candidate division WOR-3 bacterium]